MKKILAVVILSCLALPVLFGAENQTAHNALQKPMVTSDVWMNANRMNGVFRNNGTWFYDNVLGDWGLEWPKGSGLSPVFAGGQYIGAIVDGEVRVAGVQHSATEFQPGEILSPGEAANPKDGQYRWYELRTGGVGDWTNWPTDQGAPLDANGSPGLIGDQTIFSVWNDLADHGEYATKKLSVEVRQTAFAFNRADAMGDMIFIKWQLINKSGIDYDSTYFSIWQDPDLGDAGDDLVGCDTTLGLGFCYNAANNDQNYGAAPPAVGIDFFQGPIVDDPDSTVMLPDGTVLPGKKMLKMTSFIFYNNDDTPQGNPHTGGDVWNYLRGYWRDGSPITNDGANGTGAGPKTSFMFSGDPETDQGWLDSNEADRRFLMTTGPFFMAKWEDTDGNGMPDFGEPGVQEIVAGVIVARGDDNLNSVTTLKQVDELAQLAYDLNFILAKSPPAPTLSVSEMDNKAVLTWTDASEYNEDGTAYESTDPIVAQAFGDTVIIDNVETVIDDSTYNFYGYTVYQYADASGRDPVVVDHWDLGETKDASPYTGHRMIRLTANKHSAVGAVGDPLINGKEYYFGVTAIGYLEFGAPKYFESAPSIVTVVPRTTPGMNYAAEYQDSLDVTYTAINPDQPAGDGSVVAIVVDPSKTTGADYKVTFNAEGNWNLINTTSGDTLLKDQTNQRGDDAYTVIDGLLVKVIGPEPGIKEIVQLDGMNGNVIDDNLWHGLNADTGDPRFFMDSRSGALNGEYGDNTIDRFKLLTPYDFEIVFGPSHESVAWGYCCNDYADVVLDEKVPFAIYMYDPAGVIPSPYRMFITIADYGAAGTDGTWDQGIETAFTDSSGMEEIYTYYSDQGPYDPAKDADYIAANDIYAAPSYTGWGSDNNPFGYPLINRMIIGMYPEGTAGPPADGTVIRINTNKPSTANDVFAFSAPAASTIEDTLLKADLKKINVVPNPYYGYHSGERNIFERWVQFTYLPEKCTIRIFDLAGNLVRVLEKDDPGTPYLQWDLSNEYELPVASGIYIYHVKVPGVGSKVGKLAVFTPNERLDTY